MVVFSSNDARQDFERLFPTSKIRKQIVRFAVSHDPSYLTLDADKLRAKYNLPEIFFIAPNQFWAHKNHKTIVLAMEKLIAEGHSITLVFTGKEDDYRNPEYTTQIKSLVKEKGLESAIRFLGFIPRNDLLRLIDLALAVVQPSLFEGWSTVVEDSKALNKFIIASSIAVHREQLSSYLNHSLFSPENASDLADRMRDAMIQGSALIKEKYDYQADIDSYGKNVLQLFDHITN
jgi:glycosyltransferase involved in cell wall biosynthesis